MAQLLVIAMVALMAAGGNSAAGLVESGPSVVIQAAAACYGTMVRNAESMASVFTTGTPFADESCFVDCAKQLLGPMGPKVAQEAKNAVRFVPPPLRQCAEIVVGTAKGASKNECQRIVDAAQCVVKQGMAMIA